MPDAAGYYMTFQPPWGPDPNRDPYDPNIDIVLGALLGAGTPVTEPKLLATAAKLRSGWTEDAKFSYPINLADDHDRGIGPLLGRYPGDKYDGDINELDPVMGHPWAVCTCAMAELHYSVAAAIGPGGQPPNDPLAAPFLDQAQKVEPALDIVSALRAAGDRMLEVRYLPQRQPGAQRAVRPPVGLSEERLEPDVELCGVFVGRACQMIRALLRDHSRPTVAEGGLAA